MRPADIQVLCQLDKTCQSLMRSTMNQLQLSAHAYHRMLKLSRTIANLTGEEKIAPAPLAEVSQFRPKLVIM